MSSQVAILYVEDDAIVREIMRSLIQARYPELVVHAAGSAEQGLELFTEYRHAIIVTDINLGGTDGIQMARTIRKLKPEAAIIFITGSPDVGRFAEFGNGAFCSHICKPVMYDDLFALIDSSLETVAG